MYQRATTIVTTLLAVLVIGEIREAFSQAQELNPLVIEARELNEQIADSTLDAGVKMTFRSRLSNLNSEQQSLWQLAGQVDRGQCRDSCVRLYNDRVANWESQLQQFNSEARRWLQIATKPANPTQCLSRCDTEHSTCWGKCLQGPIDENAACHNACNGRKDQCVNRCYGIN